MQNSSATMDTDVWCDLENASTAGADSRRVEERQRHQDFMRPTIAKRRSLCAQKRALAERRLCIKATINPISPEQGALTSRFHQVGILLRFRVVALIRGREL